MIRFSIRQQLALLLVLSGGIGLAVLALAVWFTNHDLVVNISAEMLETTASLKSAQVAFSLDLMQTASAFVTTRTSLQRSLESYNNGSTTDLSIFDAAQTDLEATLGAIEPLADALILQVQVFSANPSGPQGVYSVLNTTGPDVNIVMPYANSDGEPVRLGDSDGGFPLMLYPNLTFTDSDGGNPPIATYNGKVLDAQSTLVLGPLMINQSHSLLSFTLPINGDEATGFGETLGWITVVTSGELILKVLQDSRGLGSTGQTLLLGPVNTTNQFAPDVIGTENADTVEVRYLIPLNETVEDRHRAHVVGTENPPFAANKFPAVVHALSEGERSRKLDRVYTDMRGSNEQDAEVSVGYTTVPTTLVDWVLIIERRRDDVWQPINRLRTIIVACLFAVVGFLSLVSFPLAHWAVWPILKLRAATEQTMEVPRENDDGDDHQSRDVSDAEKGPGSSPSTTHRSLLTKTPPTSTYCSTPKSKWYSFSSWRHWKLRWAATHVEERNDAERRFRIPGQVKNSNIWIQDEMYDLINTFNQMSRELYAQYAQLEDRVHQRTIELEHSKKAAEAANESKTLFVANVSHELKTPLNGILGMCSVSMEEDDSVKLKRALGIIYKSGDLLLRTLNDLLTFSTNQVGHQVMTLEEKEFTLRDIEIQVLSIFGDQARERQINLSVLFDEVSGENSPLQGTRRLRDVTMWGDLHRILQVVINLVSNSLKFTPANGSVVFTMRTLSELPTRHRSQASSTRRRGEDANLGSRTIAGTANFINPQAHLGAQDRARSPPPGKDIFVEFAVQDTGPGIPTSIQSKIFEPFVQGDVGLSRKHSGTGLGLSICTQLVSLMRGSIGLQSVVDEGSTFTVKIPLRHMMARDNSPASSKGQRMSVLGMDDKALPVVAEKDGTANVPARAPLDIATTAVSIVSDVRDGIALSPTTDSPIAKTFHKAAKTAQAKKAAKQDFSNVRCLIAEDNKINQEVIRKMLKLEGLTDITIAEDGEQALNLVRSSSDPSAESPLKQYDLIFMDIQMPIMDGLTSAKQIRAFGFTAPIVALTAFAEQSNIDDCYGSGMDYFLAKPIKRPQLKKVLTDYCSPSPQPKSDVVDEPSANTDHPPENDKLKGDGG